MTQPNKSGLRGCLTSRALRIVLFLLAILLLGGVFVYLLNDDDRGPVSPEMMDEAATGQKKSVYDTLDVLGNYLWRDVMKSAKADSAQWADRARGQGARGTGEGAQGPGSHASDGPGCGSRGGDGVATLPDRAYAFGSSAALRGCSQDRQGDCTEGGSHWQRLVGRVGETIAL